MKRVLTRLYRKKKMDNLEGMSEEELIEHLKSLPAPPDALVKRIQDMAASYMGLKKWKGDDA